MSKCNHTATFCEHHESPITVSGVIHSWDLQVRCHECGDKLDQSKTRTALERIYTPEIVELVLEAYEHKKLYLDAVSKLSANGIMCTLFPAVLDGSENNL